ncbi:hypothetical protein FKP32DRAFT_219290 [Trametes sanguinea]|nr:hypothetical protein FKP32DRAFT_219290 [Trametes sanguinea]
MCRFVWSIEKLQNLFILKVAFASGRDDPLDPGYRGLESLAARKSRCVFLESLVIDCEPFSSSPFPFGYVYGSCIGLLRVLGPSLKPNEDLITRETSLIRYISSLPSLQEILFILETSDGSRGEHAPDAVSWLRDSVLRRVRPCDSFRRICVEMLLGERPIRFDERRFAPDRNSELPYSTFLPQLAHSSRRWRRHASPLF